MIGRRLSRGGRPGLIGVAARTAVVAGTATAVSGRVAARHQQKAAQPAPEPMAEAAQPTTQPAASAPAPAAPVLDDQALSQLERLAALHTQGMLTAEEFSAAKQRVLQA